MNTIIGTETLYEATSESLTVTITSTADPTGDAPEFALSRYKAPAPGTFYAGDWDGAWSGGSATAVTPKIGGAEDLDISSGVKYSLWAKIVAGGETAVWIVGTVICP